MDECEHLNVQVKSDNGRFIFWLCRDCGEPGRWEMSPAVDVDKSLR